jgi:hypothetical protein
MSDDGFVCGNAHEPGYYNKKFGIVLFFIEWAIPLIFLAVVLVFAALNYALSPAFWWIPAIWLGVSVLWTIVRKTFLNEI